MKHLLGLDLGTNSIGWALLSHNFDKKEGKILGAGSRIIPMDQGILGDFEKGNSVSQTAERTAYRGTRRLRERFLLRRERLHRVLNVLGFLPEHYAEKIDFTTRLGQFKANQEPKLAYQFNNATKQPEFIFQASFNEMLRNFAEKQPGLIENGKKIPYDWTIYYLRKKALTQKITKNELAWILLHFNQKRGYYQLSEEDEVKDDNKLVEFHSLLVTKVEDTKEQNKRGQQLYRIVLQNGWEFIKPSNLPVEWEGKLKDFIVTTELDENKQVKIDKYGKEKRTFRAPAEDDWTLVKKKTEYDLDKSKKTVGCYIYDTLLKQPGQKIKGQLIRTIERKFYKEELQQILQKQQTFHPELANNQLLHACAKELYPQNEIHRQALEKKDFTYLFLNDIIFYQRPLKTKKSLISNCRYEKRYYIDKEGKTATEPLKCITKSHPLFQEFRLWQFLQNLRIYAYEKKGQLDVNVTADLLKSNDEITQLFDWLNDRKEITQKDLLKYFKLTETTHRWNYVEDKVYPCNETRHALITCMTKVDSVPGTLFSPAVNKKGSDYTPAVFNPLEENNLWHILYSVEDKAEREKALNSYAEKHQLSDDFVSVFNRFKPFKKEYGAYSAKAIKKLLPLMRCGKYWNEEAIDEKTKSRINNIITGEYDETIKNLVREKTISLNQLNDFKCLPLWLACYVVYDRHSEEGEITQWKTPADIDQYLHEFKQHQLRNPIVEQVITETLRVVKDIWIAYGQGAEGFFDEIHVELGRDMKNTIEERKKITRTVTENENTNLRIKALLLELFNDGNVENVRPYSPSQQEILKIYEEGALTASEIIPEEISKISKTAQPTPSDLRRYKLWLEQRYQSPYTGATIPLSRLFTPDYQIEHIIPQARYFDDSLSNKVICEAAVNQLKDKMTAYEFIKRRGGQRIEINGKPVDIYRLSEYEDFVKKHYVGKHGKMKKLLMEDIPDSFIERQINDTRYISKLVKNLLSNIVRENDEDSLTSKNVIATNGTITSRLKNEWGLNDIWNDLVTPRFERLNTISNTSNYGAWTNKEGKRVFQTQVPSEVAKGFSKKRIDHRHHALDAIVIACTTRDHVNYLNNESALGKNKSKEEKQKTRDDLKRKLCIKKNAITQNNYTWEFKKAWDTFTQDTKDELSKSIISFKQNLRVINKSSNYYQAWRPDEKGKLQKVFVKQVKGDNWAIRKPLHKETVSAKVTLRLKKTVSLSTAMDNWEQLADKSLRQHIKKLVTQEGYTKPKLMAYFKKNEYKWNEKDISKVEVYYINTENAASRVSLNENFDSKMIACVCNTEIQKILQKHLDLYNEEKDGKIIEHPEIAFSPDGIDNLNKNIVMLNNGKFHHPIYKVRTFEPLGNKFNVGETGNKKEKFVEAAKGTNLFFGIYINKEGKRNYETIPLHIVIERQKQKLQAVPETNKDGFSLLFHLSPNDLVYIPTEEEQESPHLFNLNNIGKEQAGRIYKAVSFTGNDAFFVPNPYAKEIVRNEMGSNNKNQNTTDGIQIKAVCWKLEVDRLGKIKRVIK